MKKTVTPILFLICLSILSFLMITLANENTMSNEEAVRLGEEKYLKFLWMVDGAFNSEIMNDDFTVNGKSLAKEDRIFTCKYKNNKCIGNNFEKEFNNLFSKTINYDDVYSDGGLYSRISRENNEYVFETINNCDINRMELDYQISVVEIKSDKIIYKIKYISKITRETSIRDLILVLEDSEWKISKTFYYDICGTKYYIG